MTKRKIIQHLKEKFNAQSHWFKPYDVTIEKNSKKIHIKIITVTNRNLVTINSKVRWDIKSGTVQGIRFKTTSVNTILLQEFIKYENPVIILTNRPYKLLKYINESEVVELQNEKEIFGIKVFYSIKDLDLFDK